MWLMRLRVLADWVKPMSDTTQSARALALGGYFMDYPSLEEVRRFIRELSFDERLSIISQGFHRGVSMVRCYSIEDFVMAIGKREFDNPAGGIRTLEHEKVSNWLREVIGDKVLGNVVDAIYANSMNIAEAVDTLRVMVFVRMNQYNEVLAEAKEDGQC